MLLEKLHDLPESVGPETRARAHARFGERVTATHHTLRPDLRLSPLVLTCTGFPHVIAGAAASAATGAAAAAGAASELLLRFPGARASFTWCSGSLKFSQS